MRFLPVFTSLVATGLISNSVIAAPTTDLVLSNEVNEPKKMLKRSLGAGQVLTIVKAVTAQAQIMQTNINQALVGINWSSNQTARKAAGQKVIAQFGTLTTALNQAVTNVTQQANTQNPAAIKSRQASPGHNETQDLINALAALVNLIDTTIIQVISALGLSELVAPAMSALAVLSTFFLTIAAVVVDFLPFLGPIGTFLGGIGSIIGGIGSLIPKSPV